MRKSFEIKELREFPIRMTRQTPAFSLVELIVSMGILMLMLALAGQVMSITVRSTGQAKALTEISQALRILETTLREDLSHVKAGESLLLIQGNPIDAYWSTVEKEADSKRDVKPRADILMFFTSRQASNYVKYSYPLTPDMSGKAVTSGVQQVVYGHANLVDLDANGNIYGTYPADYITFPEDDLTPYPVPADEWHLARRVVHLLNLPGTPPRARPAWADAAIPDPLGDLRILQGETDVITRFDFKRWVLTADTGPIGASPFFWPMIFNNAAQPPHARSVLDPAPPPRYADRLGHYFIPHCVSFRVEWTLDRKGDYVAGNLNGEKELYWIDPGAADPLGEIERVIDETTDLMQAGFLNLLLGDNRGDGGAYNLRARFGGPKNDGYIANWHAHGFGDNVRPNLTVFTAERATDPLLGPVQTLKETVFPAALRITIDLVDDQKRLDRATRHVMIIPVGG